MKIFQNKKLTSNATDIDATKIPKHIAFICDGNGRWAQSRGLPRYEGHKAGVEAIKKVVSRCQELGVEVVSFYCFSTENFSRPKAEVEYLFKLFKKIENYENDPYFKDAKIVVMGDLSLFPDELQTLLHGVVERTRNNSKITVNLGLGYGGRREIASAFNKMIQDGIKEVSEEDIKKYLYTSDLPDPDLIVRASGEQRLSNFMLFQAAYTEFYFPETYWPDFDDKMVDECVKVFQSRKRRFGKV